MGVWLTDYGLVAVLVSFKDVTGLLQLCQGVDDLSSWKLGEAANQFIAVHAIYMVVGVVGSCGGRWRSNMPASHTHQMSTAAHTAGPVP